MWIGKRGDPDRLNDYWNALDRHAPPDELARLRALIDPELSATIETTRARFRRLRPDPAFSDRLEGELMNAFVLSPSGTAALPRVPAPFPNGRLEPATRSSWIPALDTPHTNRRGLALKIGMVALLLLALSGGFFVFSNRSEHPAVLQEATPVSTPTADWTNTRGDAGRTGLGESGPIGQPVTIWRFQADGPCDSSPAAVGNTVFAACGTGILYAIDRATGKERWEYDARAPIAGGPSVVDGIVTLIDVDGRLYGVDASTGAEAWIVDGVFTGSPIGAPGVIVASGADGYLTAFDMGTGQKRWRTLIDESGETKSPAIADGMVYAGSVGSGFTAVEITTGAIVWQAGTDGIETGTAVVANGVAYIGSAPGVPDGFLKAFDAKTGDELWTNDQPIFTPAVQDGTGYAGSGSGEVTSIDLASGEMNWQVTVGGVARPAAVAGDVVYMNSDGDQAIYAFDTSSGDQLWKFPVDGYLSDAPALKDGVLYAATGGGSVYALGGENAIPAPGAAIASPQPAASAIPAATVASSPVAGASVAIASDLVWSTSGGDGGLSQPGYVTIAPDGKIWVADNDNHRFQIFAPDGSFIETWGAKGTGDGQFSMRNANGDGMSRVQFAPDGSFYVLDPGNFRVQHFDANRQFIKSFGAFGTKPGQFSFPTSLIVDDAGTVWVFDIGQSNVQHFAADGTLLDALPVEGAQGGGVNGNSMAVAPDGTLYVTDCGRNCDTFGLLHYSADGELLGVIESAPDVPWATHQPVDIAFDTNGNLYITTMIWNKPVGYVLVFSQTGEFVTSWHIGGNPYGIALDGEGNAYIVQWTEDTLSKYQLSSFTTSRATPVA